MSRLIPTGLRMSSLALRFLLVFALAHYLPVATVGLYGLVAASIAYAIYPLGFDFYTYTTRQIMRGSRTRWRTFVVSQLAFAGIVFLIITPALTSLFASGLLPWTVAAWFFVILPLEYLGIEIDRFLIAMADQLGASIVLFLGGALAPLTVIPLFWIYPRTRSLSTVFGAWAAYDAIAVVAGVMLVVHATRGPGRLAVDWKWIRRGVVASLPFLAATVCVRALFTVDRQAIKAFGDLSALGAYTLYMSIGTAMTSILYAGVQQFSYPRLVQAAHDQDSAAFKGHLRVFFTQTAGGILVISAVALAAQPLLLHVVQGDAYEDYSWVLPTALAVAGLYNLSMVPHYALYALDADRAILITTVMSLVAFVGVIATFERESAVGSVLGGIGGASAVLLIGKTLAFLKTQSARGAPDLDTASTGGIGSIQGPRSS